MINFPHNDGKKLSHTNVLIYLAYGCLSITGGGVPAALALNTAAHACSSGHSGRWSRCQGTGAETVETCSTLLHKVREAHTPRWALYFYSCLQYTLTDAHAPHSTWFHIISPNFCLSGQLLTTLFHTYTQLRVIPFSNFWTLTCSLPCAHIHTLRHARELSLLFCNN